VYNFSMKKIFRFRYFLVFTILISVTFLLRHQITASTQSIPKYNPKKDTLFTPQIQTIQDTLTLAGSIDSSSVANVRFQNSGKLVWVGVKVGDRVKKWQALASLDKNELKKNLSTQYNDYRTRLGEFQDTQDTYKNTREKYLVTDTISRILDRTQYSLNRSVIDYEIADMAIKEATIYSPLSGIIVAIDQPLAGVNITPATATFTIIDPNSLYFKSEIDQEAVTKIKSEEPVSIKLDSYPNLNIESKVTYVAFTPVVGQSSTVYEIRFELPLLNNDLNYRIGMDGDVNIVLAEAQNTLTIPTDAINDDNGKIFVYLKSGSELKRKDIKIGIENDTTTQVTEGLTINDQVVVIQK